jgi:hypothetical protein
LIGSPGARTGNGACLLKVLMDPAKAGNPFGRGSRSPTLTLIGTATEVPVLKRRDDAAPAAAARLPDWRRPSGGVQCTSSQLRGRRRA